MARGLGDERGFAYFTFDDDVQREAAATDPVGFVAELPEREGRRLVERVAGGGYPGALTRTPGRRRTAWYRDYADTLIQRDIRDLARISALEALARLLARLLALAAGQTACLVNTF